MAANSAQVSPTRLTSAADPTLLEEERLVQWLAEVQAQEASLAQGVTATNGIDVLTYLFLQVNRLVRFVASLFAWVSGRLDAFSSRVVAVEQGLGAVGSNAEASLKSIVSEAQATFDGVAQSTVDMQGRIDSKFSELESKGSTLEQKVSDSGARAEHSG